LLCADDLTDVFEGQRIVDYAEFATECQVKKFIVPDHGGGLDLLRGE
jgi:hypothetical protein